MITFFFFTTVFGQERARPSCPDFPKGGYKFTEEAKFSVLDDESAFITELQFFCVYSAMTSMKVMYENYGAWNYRIEAPNKNGNLLFWNNINLFQNENKKYTIIARGKEDYGYIFTSFMVLDQNGNDVLTDPETIKKFEKRLGRLIRNENRESRNFYKVYYNSIDPEIWRKIQGIKSRKPVKNN